MKILNMQKISKVTVLVFKYNDRDKYTDLRIIEQEKFI